MISSALNYLFKISYCQPFSDVSLKYVHNEILGIVNETGWFCCKLSLEPGLWKDDSWIPCFPTQKVNKVLNIVSSDFISTG